MYIDRRQKLWNSHARVDWIWPAADSYGSKHTAFIITINSQLHCLAKDCVREHKCVISSHINSHASTRFAEGGRVVAEQNTKSRQQAQKLPVWQSPS
jgi:hypothetical protein